MPQLRYSGDDRYYPDLALTVTDGDVVDLEDDPGDGRWSPAPTKPASPAADTAGGK